MCFALPLQFVSSAFEPQHRGCRSREKHVGNVTDVVPDASAEPIDIRLFLRVGGKALTETWLYQWTPVRPV